jgi:hypothetical protein
MINPQKGINLMNNTSIINIILFAVTIFQHVPKMEPYVTPHIGMSDNDIFSGVT